MTRGWSIYVYLIGLLMLGIAFGVGYWFGEYGGKTSDITAPRKEQSN